VTVLAALAACAAVMPLAFHPAAAPASGLASTPAALQARGFRGNFPPPRRGVFAVRPDRSRSWMSADAKTTASLLYVADEGTNTVDVFSYPQGKLEGQLTGFDLPSGICSDRAGDVYIENGNAYTVEVYAHGGTAPLRTLALPGYPQLNCTVDPVTQNLALGTFDGSCGGCLGYIAIFTGGQGTPTLYQPSTGNPLHEQQGLPGCAYDGKGDLFCDAYIGPSGENFGLFELPKRSRKVSEITVSGANFRAGAAQWDGAHVDVDASSFGTLYQIALSGSAGTVVGSTVLETGAWVWQFCIPNQDARVVAPVSYGSTEYVGYWSYPAGGTPTRTIDGFTQVDGATVSTIK
jgi:hypothetical protein